MITRAVLRAIKIMYVNTEILYPSYVTPVLRDLRGPEWRDLVDRVISLPEDHPEVLDKSNLLQSLRGPRTSVGSHEQCLDHVAAPIEGSGVPTCRGYLVERRFDVPVVL